MSVCQNKKKCQSLLVRTIITKCFGL